MPKHAVVDGSNIATESRTEPSLQQLREAVAKFKAEYAFEIVTVIVDASFEHRVAKAEQKAARAAIDTNEIITPPAGVIGRGDTFILQVADRAQAVVLSNDSFQEFHGAFEWLFDEGRLIGGKPIPGVGWIFVPRAPVRGPVSRRARATAEGGESKRTEAKKQPVKKATKKTVKKATKKTAQRATKKTVKKATKKTVKKATKKTPATTRDHALEAAASTSPGSNPRAAWEAFRSRHPEGSRVKATVEEFSSHGAYAASGEMTLYLPLRLMGDPAPARVRDVVTIGQSRSFIIHRFDEGRLGIDAGIIAFEGSSGTPRRPTETSGKRPPRTRATGAAKKATAKKTATKKTATKKTAAKRAPATKKTTANRVRAPKR